jgi:peptidoglycan-associated lipoprotein
MKTRLWSWPVLILVAMVLTACGGAPKKDEGAAQVQDRTAGAQVAGPQGADAQTAGAAGASGIYAAQLNDPNSALYQKVVYFDFDKSTIRADFVDTLRAHAAFLSSNPELKVSVEGHCDERGSREYNIGLGERRANAVLTFLAAEGVDASQVSTISYGEERPAADGHDESAWSQNRRAVLVYQ